MLRVAMLAAVIVVLAGCGDEAPSRQVATATATSPAMTEERRAFFRTMEDLGGRLDRSIVAAIDRDPEALARIKRLLGQIRRQLRTTESAGGELLLTSALTARDYVRDGYHEGLAQVRIPVLEARDTLENEASR